MLLLYILGVGGFTRNKNIIPPHKEFFKGEYVSDIKKTSY